MNQFSHFDIMPIMSETSLFFVLYDNNSATWVQKSFEELKQLNEPNALIAPVLGGITGDVIKWSEIFKELPQAPEPDNNDLKEMIRLLSKIKSDLKELTDDSLETNSKVRTVCQFFIYSFILGALGTISMFFFAMR